MTDTNKALISTIRLLYSHPFPAWVAFTMGFSVHLDKEYLKFSSSHFTLLDGGTREQLHGHNYAVAVEVRGEQLHHGLLVELRALKNIIQNICNDLDDRILLPQKSTRITTSTHNVFTEQIIVDGDVVFQFPKENLSWLPIDNISMENLSYFIWSRICKERPQWDPHHHGKHICVWVEESPGQRASYENSLDETLIQP